jgi:hypothetical protein
VVNRFYILEIVVIILLRWISTRNYWAKDSEYFKYSKYMFLCIQLLLRMLYESIRVEHCKTCLLMLIYFLCSLFTFLPFAYISLMMYMLLLMIFKNYSIGEFIFLCICCKYLPQSESYYFVASYLAAFASE